MAKFLPGVLQPALDFTRFFGAALLQTVPKLVKCGGNDEDEKCVLKVLFDLQTPLNVNVKDNGAPHGKVGVDKGAGCSVKIIMNFGPLQERPSLNSLLKFPPADEKVMDPFLFFSSF